MLSSLPGSPTFYPPSQRIPRLPPGGACTLEACPQMCTSGKHESPTSTKQLWRSTTTLLAGARTCTWACCCDCRRFPSALVLTCTLPAARCCLAHKCCQDNTQTRRRAGCGFKSSCPSRCLPPCTSTQGAAWLLPGIGDDTSPGGSHAALQKHNRQHMPLWGWNPQLPRDD